MTPYRLRGQRFSLSWRRWYCSASWVWGCRWLFAGRRPCRCCVSAPSRWWCPRRWPPVPVWRRWRRRFAALPGLGVLRDGQKWVALAVPGYALAGAAAVVALRQRLPAAATALICCAALVATLPDLAWGVGGKMAAVQYPPGWATVAAMINADPRPVAVLPVDSMRRFEWAGDAPVLDPLPRWVRADVLTSGDLTIGGRTVPGEGERARAVQQMLLSGADRDQLAAAGSAGWSSNPVIPQMLWRSRWLTATTTSPSTGWAATIRRRRGGASCWPHTSPGWPCWSVAWQGYSQGQGAGARRERLTRRVIPKRRFIHR